MDERERILKELRRQLERAREMSAHWDNVCSPRSDVDARACDVASTESRAAIDQALQELDKLEKAL